jgi:hypothetical protein
LGLAEAPEEEVRRAVELAGKGRRVVLWDELLEKSKLISQYGKPAAAALVGRGVTLAAAREILAKEQKMSGRFFELLLQKEREALFKRFRWT